MSLNRVDAVPVWMTRAELQELCVLRMGSDPMPSNTDTDLVDAVLDRAAGEFGFAGGWVSAYPHGRFPVHECDCEDNARGLVSNECPVHNESPKAPPAGSSDAQDKPLATLTALVEAAQTLGYWSTLRSTDEATIDYWTRYVDDMARRLSDPPAAPTAVLYVARRDGKVAHLLANVADLPEGKHLLWTQPLRYGVDTGNLVSDPLYVALDALYSRGWTDHYKGRKHDPRGTNEWQAVLDLFREHRAGCDQVIRGVTAERPEDMSQGGRLQVFAQEDGDMCIMVVEDSGQSAGIEFCCSGGRSPRTLEAVRALSRAMARDNLERPIVRGRGGE